MEKFRLGIDVGSTTVKAVVLDQDNKVIYARYLRHGSKVKETCLEELEEISNKLGNVSCQVCFTGSAGLGLSERSHVPFVQEVEASYLAIKTFLPQIDAAIELGGEDAKIVFITGGLEERMNGSCAGGTGAFIDQMATLLNVGLPEMDEMALEASKAYPIASRCGVFAKSDVQSILNQGAKKEDVALSIFYAVADQTIAGLAQGREIKGNILFLGGPLFFLKGLRNAFVDKLHLEKQQAYFPPDADTFMAKGAALQATKFEELTLKEIKERIANAPMNGSILTGERLFKDEEDYKQWLIDHKDHDIAYGDLTTYEGKAYLGIDEGSTTTKLVLIGEDSQILYSHYQPNNGLPIDSIVSCLKEIYTKASPKLKIISSAVTGYGEELIKSALKVDYGLVETVAHFKAAKFYEPDVDFVIDIGGQDMKCFKIRNHAIDSIMLNEACSSGCGSFLSSFALALGYDVETFSKLGLYAPDPVELGSRCTVFMNSSVKQAQREGACIEDISAGLSRSVVKNALYKVIRVRSFRDLGEKILCQGGTFLNDAVLRSFEMEIGHKVIRPSISGLMGAFGAALYAKEKGGEGKLLPKEDLDNFEYKSFHSTCKGCTAHCNLTILTFPRGGSFVSGNKCEKGEGRKPASNELDMYAYKRQRLLDLLPQPENPKKTVGLPLSLIMYEQLPLWDTFFKELGFKIIVSPFSNRQIYYQGQKTIPSDTACYPAKLMHGHIDYLLNENVDFIFYPSETYNFDEGRASNHYNCPVVAYYGELLRQNDVRLETTPLIDPFIDPNNHGKSKKTLFEALKGYGVSLKEIGHALEKGYQAYEEYRNDVKKKGEEIIARARQENKLIIALIGRPYHLDPEVGHGIDKLLDSLGVALLSEDCLPFKKELTKVNVLNQWTFHARLYDAAEYVSSQPDMELVQMVSFGCGVDAITSDEVKSIMENKGRLYTLIKIDEISNLGAVKIRLRSLLSAIEEKKKG